MNVKLLFLDTREKQLKAKKDFQDLFLESFDKPMTDDQWKHFYLNAPFGQTISFIYYDNGRMVAHGGLIPQQLISKNGEKQNYFLQTGVMVRKRYQTLLLFKELMDSMSSYVNSRGAFAIAFPNDKIYLPFVKMLRWRLVREYSIIQYSLNEGNLKNKQCSDWDDFDYELYKPEPFINWRRELNKFEFYRTEEFEIIYKDYKGSFEILDISLSKKKVCIPIYEITRFFKYQKVNIPECFSHLFSFKGLVPEGTAGVPQRMCFYPSSHGKCLYEQIKPSLLLSDVF